MSQRNLKRPRDEDETNDLDDYCKYLTSEDLRDPENPWLDRICSEKTSVDEQIPFVITAVAASDSDRNKCMNVYKVVELILQKEFRKKLLGVRPFGSIVTKLALKDSDIDIVLDFGGKLPLPPKVLVKFISKVVRSSKFFQRAIPIFAKVPIVRCVHWNRVSVDISFSNSLVIENSKLVAFLLALDPRARELAIILKFFFKKHGILGTPGFSSYGMTNLIIFYLQQLSPPILPSVARLQSLASDRQILEGWNVSFAADKTKLETEATNSMTLLELLRGFFRLCAEFEFGMYVVSSFAGKCFPRPLFSDAKLLPEEFVIHRELMSRDPAANALDMASWICVQEPFAHSRNLTRNIAPQYLTAFEEVCSRFANACENATTDRFFFRELLGAPATAKKRKTDAKASNARRIPVFLRDCSNLSFATGEDVTEESIRRKWTDSVVSVIRTVIKDVMKCQMEESANRVLRCRMDHDVLSPKRRFEAKKERSLPQCPLCIDTEASISDSLLQSLGNGQKLFVTFDVRVTIEAKPTRAVLDVTTAGNVKAPAARECLAHVFNFFEKLLPRIIDMSVRDGSRGEGDNASSSSSSASSAELSENPGA